MVARVWQGRTKPEHFDKYTQFMKDRAIPDYKSTEGFVKLTFLRRRDEDFAYFELITFWQNMEVIKNFAGDDHDKAKYYPEDKKYLIDFPKEVIHFEVFANERLN
jgi:heme-degrading monooxygenase HmoA